MSEVSLSGQPIAVTDESGGKVSFPNPQLNFDAVKQSFGRGNTTVLHEQQHSMNFPVQKLNLEFGVCY